MIVKYLYDYNTPINEERYYMTQSGLNFNRTGGAKEKRGKGLLKALPGLAITTFVCWPMALLGAIGALSYRWQKRWENRDAKRHILTPQYWTDYLANPHESDDKNKKDDKNDNDSNTTNTTNTTNDNNTTSTAIAAGTGVVAGGLLADKLKELTPEERKNRDFKVYWVKMSNGEIVRVRAFDENGAKEVVNIIIKTTEKPCYKVLNDNISAGLPKYTFYFDSGEIVQWSGKDKKSAFEQAIATRKGLCEVLNKEYPDITKMDPMDLPKKAIKSISKKGEKIEIPKLNNYTIYKTKPVFDDSYSTNRMFYEWGTLKHFKTKFSVFNNITLPSENEKDAEKIIREFFNEIKSDLQSIMNMMNSSYKLYKITFVDGDIYHIPGKTENEATELGKKIHLSKFKVIEQNMTGVNHDDWEEIINDFNIKVKHRFDIKDIKQVIETPETYSPPKNPKKFKLIKYINKNDSVEYGPYELW